ncbi:hypothetical protein PIB30_023998, partial [Stylosanthes scabra]|nr:hypothetical protein [Stylosanthes scabra]
MRSPRTSAGTGWGCTCKALRCLRYNSSAVGNCIVRGGVTTPLTPRRVEVGTCRATTWVGFELTSWTELVWGQVKSGRHRRLVSQQVGDWSHNRPVDLAGVTPFSTHAPHLSNMNMTQRFHSPTVADISVVGSSSVGNLRWGARRQSRFGTKAGGGRLEYKRNNNEPGSEEWPEWKCAFRRGICSRSRSVRCMANPMRVNM